jgi:hypothetical protein
MTDMIGFGHAPGNEAKVAPVFGKVICPLTFYQEWVSKLGWPQRAFIYPV